MRSRDYLVEDLVIAIFSGAWPRTRDESKLSVTDLAISGVNLAEAVADELEKRRDNSISVERVPE